MPRSLRSSLALVCPSFTDAITRQPQRLPALERLVSYAGQVSATIPARDLDTWQCELLTALALSDTWQYSSAALTLTGDGHDLGSGTWLHADLVEQTIAAHGLTMCCSGPQNPATLVAIESLVRDHLAAVQMSWQVVDGRSYLRFATPIDVQTMSVRQAVLGELRDALPTGPDAATLRRVMTELQMLLHEKFAFPQAPNAVWLWGGGGQLQLPPKKLPPLWTNDAYARGIYRAHAAEHACSILPRTLDSIFEQAVNGPTEAPLLAVIRDCDPDALERDWFAPARRALDRGRVQRVDVYLDGWQLQARRSFVRRLFARSQPVTEWLT